MVPPKLLNSPSCLSCELLACHAGVVAGLERHSAVALTDMLASRTIDGVPALSPNALERFFPVAPGLTRQHSWILPGGTS